MHALSQSQPAFFLTGVYLWDMDRIGQQVEEDEEDEVVPELLFQHGGHTSRVLDLSWNPNEDEAWVISSVQVPTLMLALSQPHASSGPLPSGWLSIGVIGPAWYPTVLSAH